MDGLPVLIQAGLTSARFWMPVQKRWVEPGIPVSIAETLTPNEIRSRDQLVVVDSILASTLLNDHKIVTAFAIASRNISALNLVTDRRPDRVEEVVIATPGVSLSGRAVAETVIPRYYGIAISAWTHQIHDVDEHHAIVSEGVNALVQEPDDEFFHEDLGRAWFLFTDAPFVSHVCLVPVAVASSDPERLQVSLTRLRSILQAADSHGRELRRNLSRDHDIDRDVITDLLADQTNQLGEKELTGLSTLYSQTGVLSDPGSLNKALLDFSS